MALFSHHAGTKDRTQVLSFTASTFLPEPASAPAPETPFDLTLEMRENMRPPTPGCTSLEAGVRILEISKEDESPSRVKSGVTVPQKGDRAHATQSWDARCPSTTVARCLYHSLRDSWGYPNHLFLFVPQDICSYLPRDCRAPMLKKHTAKSPDPGHVCQQGGDRNRSRRRWSFLCRGLLIQQHGCSGEESHP